MFIPCTHTGRSRWRSSTTSFTLKKYIEPTLLPLPPPSPLSLGEYSFAPPIVEVGEPAAVVELIAAGEAAVMDAVVITSPETLNPAGDMPTASPPCIAEALAAVSGERLSAAAVAENRGGNCGGDGGRPACFSEIAAWPLPVVSSGALGLGGVTATEGAAATTFEVEADGLLLEGDFPEGDLEGDLLEGDLLSFFSFELFDGSSDGFAFVGVARRAAIFEGEPTPPGGGPTFIFTAPGGLFSVSAP